MQVIFLCQAAGDIVHILGEIEKFNKIESDVCIYIFCLERKHSLKSCFSLLSLNNVIIDSLLSIEPCIRYPWKRWWYRKKTTKLLINKGILSNNTIVYFTSIYDDPVTIGYLGVLIRNHCRICYLNHYDDSQNIVPLNKYSISECCKLMLYYFFTGVPLSYYSMSNRWNVLRFPKEKYNIEEIKSKIDINICNKYSYSIGLPSKKTVLFFSQPNREKSLISDEEYNQIHFDVVEKLKALKYYIVIKGHPMLGICPINESQADLILPNKLPSELLNYKHVESCYGFMTIALATTAKLGVKTYTILPLMKDKTSLAYEGAIDYINMTGEFKINYLNDLNDIV